MTGAEHARPRLLIEEWLPAAAIGVESMRERGSASALAPNSFLHVWWARRPLTVSRAAVLASLLPADFERATFERLLGFSYAGEHLVAIRAQMDAGIQVKGGFNAPRAFANTIPEPHLQAAHEAMLATWGERPTVLDPMSGGGSIPLEAARFGLTTLANEYNPVACSVLEATVDYPFRFPPALADAAAKWGARLTKSVEEEIGSCFPREENALVHAYVYARTVPCPDTGAPTPLVPDWHVQKPKSGKMVVAEPVVDRENLTWTVRIRDIGSAAGQLKSAPKPTYQRGKAVSIFSGASIDGEYIKAMAAQGKLGSTLYAVVLKTANGLRFRPAELADLDALAAAEAELARRLPEWERTGTIPDEVFPRATTDPRPLQYGMPRWRDMFSPRQLLTMGVLVEQLHALRPAILDAEGEEQGAAIEHLLAFALDKFLNHNAILASWDPTTNGIRSVFDRHDFSFKSTWAEMAPCGSGAGFAWAIGNCLEAWRRVASLPRDNAAQPAVVSLGSATDLAALGDQSVTAVVVDPPYADNVQYSELADFFYVWLKRTQGHRRPEWFSSYLSQRESEAVVNAARMIPDYDPDTKYPTGTKKAAKARGEALYRTLMTQVFNEARRVLRDDGVLTVMFTHKQQSAWEALFGSLIDAGFTITATWPVRTESPHSLHIAAKNAAESTVVLVARKRQGEETGYFTLELRNEIRAAARASAERLAAAGLNAVDQLVGSFGPAVEVFSRYKTVRRDTGEIVFVGEALDEAADAVVEWRVERLMPTENRIGLAGVDQASRYTVMCWDVLAAAQFRFNEAKLLGHAVGLDPDDLVKAGIAAKKSANVILTPASERRRAHALTPDEEPTAAERKLVHPMDPSFRSAIDAAHALVQEYQDGGGGQSGLGAARRLALRHQWSAGSPVARLVEALVRASPPGMRIAGKGTADRYPEFIAWREMLRPLFGVEPPDWTEQAPLTPQLPGLEAALSWESDEESEELDDESDDEDEESDG